jgi:hypothetical protein
MPLGGGLILGAAAAQAGLGIAKSISGFSQQAKAKKEMANLATPFYKIQNEYYQNRNIAEQLATGGMPQSELNYATTENQRALGSTLGTLTQTGSVSPNEIAKMFDVYGRTTARTTAESAGMHLANIDKFLERNSQLAGQKTMQWAINEKGVYDAKVRELKERMAVGQQNAWGGLGDAISGVAAAGTGMQNNALLKQQKTPTAFQQFSSSVEPIVTQADSNKPAMVLPSTPVGGTLSESSMPNVTNIMRTDTPLGLNTVVNSPTNVSSSTQPTLREQSMWNNENIN